MFLRKRLNRAFNSLTKCVIKHFIAQLEKPENRKAICRDFVDPTVDFALRQTIIKIHTIDSETPFLKKMVKSSEKYLAKKLNPSFQVASLGFSLVLCLLIGLNYHIYLLNQRITQMTS